MRNIQVTHPRNETRSPEGKKAKCRMFLRAEVLKQNKNPHFEGAVFKLTLLLIGLNLVGSRLPTDVRSQNGYTFELFCNYDGTSESVFQ